MIYEAFIQIITINQLLEYHSRAKDMKNSTSHPGLIFSEYKIILAFKFLLKLFLI